MRFAGAGAGLWHVRVDLLAPDGSGDRVARAADALAAALDGGDGGDGRDLGADQGVGVEGQPVVGLTFWARADDVGAAARTALDVARRAGAAAGVGPAYYSVTLVPSDAVVVPLHEHDIPLPD